MKTELSVSPFLSALVRLAGMKMRDLELSEMANYRAKRVNKLNKEKKCQTQLQGFIIQ